MKPRNLLGDVIKLSFEISGSDWVLVGECRQGHVRLIFGVDAYLAKA